MPILDRFWWLRLCQALLLAALTIFLGYLIWAVPAWSPDLLADAFVVLLPLALAAWASVSVVLAFAARRRKRLRLALQRGETSTLLSAHPAAISAVAAAAPGVDLPLRMLWRDRWPARLLSSLVIVCLVWPPCSILLLVLPLWLPFHFFRTLPLYGAYGTIGYIGGIVLLSLIGASALGRPFGVIADEEGIRLVPRWGRSRLVRWSEVRLFEVRGPTMWERRFWGASSGIQVYTLYGATGNVRWPAFARTSVLTPRTVGAPPDERRQQEEALLAVIAARTNLTPHSIGALLRPQPVHLSPVPRSREVLVGRLAEIIVAAVSISSLLSFFINVLISPLSNVPAFNWAVALSLPAATTLPIAVQFLRRFRPAQSETSSDEPLAPDAIYAWIQPGRRADGLLACVSGAVLLVDLLPALALWFPALAQRLLGTPVLITPGNEQFVAYACAFAGILGLLVVMGGVNGLIHPRDQRIVIDDAGIRANQSVQGTAARARRSEVRVPWKDVRSVQWVPWPRPHGAYTVTIQTRKVGILALPIAGPWRTIPRSNDAEQILIGPEAMARTIATRAGIRLTHARPADTSLSTRLRWLGERIAEQQTVSEED